jgi:outer membrane protein assembly factor BamB
MWRHDASRGAATSEALPPSLSLQWFRELHPPRPAWPESQYKLQFDASYEPIIMERTLYVGSMVSDCVTAYDTASGREKWRFYADGPVRFAPVGYQGKLYFVSDDGYLYCLNAFNGRLIRKFRGGLADNKVIGNDRLVGMWPARGGPALYDGKLYFAAGIWPFMGTIIHALDAGTGKVVWTNSSSGSTYLMQPHHSPAFAGVAPQGYLAATQDRLLLAGGRSVPAGYDRNTGDFLYYHLDRYGKAGGCEVMVVGDYFFNRGAIHKLSDGLDFSRAPASLVDDDVIIGIREGNLMAYTLEPGAKKAKRLWQIQVPSELKKIHIKAGDRLYGSGEGGAVFAIDVPNNDGQPEVSWQGKVEGDVWNMLAADGKLLVVTLQGSLYCFGAKRIEPERHALETRPLSVGSRRWRRKTRRILETTQVSDGYCLLLGLGTGELLYQLLLQSELYIVALDPDASKVAAMRRRLDEAGQYGTRVSVHVGDVTTMRLPPYMANLVVSEDLEAGGIRNGRSFVERVFRSLRPYGGTASFFAPHRKRLAISKWADKAQLPNCKTTSSGRFLMLTRDGALVDSADWTHQYGDSANTVRSGDKRVKAPLGLLWFGGPPNDEILPRHGHGPSPQVVGGRLFIEGRNILRAVDVYTGRLLWEREFQDLGKYYDNKGHQPGANEIGGNYVSVSDAVYVVYEDSILMLDPATGGTIREFSMPRENKPCWGAIVVWQDLLLATASPISIPLSKDSKGTKLPDNMQPIIKRGADWEYLVGDHPNDAWTLLDFSEEGWKTSTGGFGYGDDDDKTVLKDMEDHYSAVYIRKVFTVSEPNNIHELGLVINYDDAFIAYLNGKETLRIGVGKGRGEETSEVDSHEAKGHEYFKINNHGRLLRKGMNVLAIEGHNDGVDSGDFTLDPYLVVRHDGKPGVSKSGKHATLDNIPGVTVNAEYSSGSKTLVAMDRHNGEVLWELDAEYSFRHNTIVVGGGKVFCIDGLSAAKLAYLKHVGFEFEGKRTLYALNARTAEPLWETNKDIFGTWLSYSVEHDILLQAGSQSGDRARDEAGKGMIAYRASDGKVLWHTDESYKGPPILHHEKIITQTGGGSGSAAAEAKVFNLLTGQRVTRTHPLTGQTIPWTWVRFKGCNTAVASENLLTFRSASGAFVDLNRGQGTASLGGFKSGCTSNLIVANGVLNAPDYTRTCTCSYQNQASLALVHMPEVEHWTFDYYPSSDSVTPVRQVGINFGAPGNRTGDNGTLWLEFPSVGGPSPDIPVRARYDNPQWFHNHSSQVKGSYNWVGASGVEGVKEVSIRLFLQPAKESSSVDAFDKHIGQIPTWREEQIKGSFNQPQPYTVRLYFAEPKDLKSGRRIFHVSLQGRQVLKNFDVAREAGTTNRCVVKEFNRILIKDDLKISLAPAAAQNVSPVLSGIEIIAEN